MQRSVTAVLFLFIMLMSCGRQVDVYSRKGTKWNAYNSFAVGPGELVVVLPDSINKGRIVSNVEEAIATELQGRGLELTTKDSADLRVVFTAEVVESLTMEDVGPLGKAPADQPVEMDQSRVWSQRVRNGALAMEVVDTRSGETVWRSKTSLDFAGDDFSLVLNAAVGKSLRKFPIE